MIISREDIKLGLLFWWGVDDVGDNCPVIAIEVKKKWFRIKYLDNCRESGHISTNLSKNFHTTPVQTCSLEYAQEYCKKRMKSLDNLVTKKINELKKAKKTLGEYKKSVRTLLKKCS